MEGDGQLNNGQSLDEVIALLSPQAKEALSILSEEKQRQLFSFLKEEAEKSRVKDDARAQAKEEELEKFDSFIEEGKKYIDKDKWQEWEKYESQFKGQIFSLDVIDRTVKVMEMLDTGVAPEEIKKKMLDEWSGDGYFSIRKTVIYFSKHGKKFEKMSKRRLRTGESVFEKMKNNIFEIFE